VRHAARGAPAGVYGQLQREGEVVHLIAKRLTDLSPLLGRLRVESRDFR